MNSTTAHRGEKDAGDAQLGRGKSCVIPAPTTSRQGLDRRTGSSHAGSTHTRCAMPSSCTASTQSSPQRPARCLEPCCKHSPSPDAEQLAAACSQALRASSPGPPSTHHHLSILCIAPLSAPGGESFPHCLPGMKSRAVVAVKTIQQAGWYILELRSARG